MSGWVDGLSHVVSQNATGLQLQRGVSRFWGFSRLLHQGVAVQGRCGDVEHWFEGLWILVPHGSTCSNGLIHFIPHFYNLLSSFIPQETLFNWLCGTPVLNGFEASIMARWPRWPSGANSTHLTRLPHCVLAGAVALVDGPPGSHWGCSKQPALLESDTCTHVISSFIESVTCVNFMDNQVHVDIIYCHMIS